MSDDGRRRFEERTRALEALGHRGSATAHEDRAADLAIAELARMGITASKEPFGGSDSFGARIALHVLVALAGLALLRLAPLATAGIGLLVLASFRIEMRTRGLVLGRLLRRRPSRNVVARLAPAPGPARASVVLCAHMDSQRTGLMWRGGLVRPLSALYQRLPGPMRSPTFPIVAAFAAQPVLGALELLWPGSPVVAGAAVVVGLVYLVAALLLLDWARGPFVPGAADNASGVAAALELAGRWAGGEAAEGVELVVLLSGCEETGALGAAAWLEAHRAEVEARPHAFLVLDTFGYGAPRFVGCEHPLDTMPLAFPRHVLALCAAAARDLGLDDAGPHVLPTFTDATAFLARDIPGAALLTFEDGVHMPNYHQLSDTADAMDFEVGYRAVELAWRVLLALAASVGAGASPPPELLGRRP